MKNKLYIFNGTSRATMYGVGTYIEQIINLLKDKDIDLIIIEFNTNEKEIKIVDKIGYQIIYVPEANKSALFNDKRNNYYFRNICYLLKEFISNETRNIFHLNCMANERLAFWLKKLFGATVIQTVHYTEWSYTLLGDINRLRRILKKDDKDITDIFEKGIKTSIDNDKQMIDQCDMVICIAQHSFESIKETCYINNEKLFLINNGLMDMYKPYSKFKKEKLKEMNHIEPTDKIILFAGRLDEVKGILFLIKAFKKLLKTHENTRLIIAGDGNYSKWLSETNGFWSKVSFTGRLSKKHLYILYNIADLGIVCSIHEEFGFVAIEMMMHELPIIVSDVGGLSEIVDNNQNGLKVPVKVVKGKRIINTNILSEKMQFIIDNPEMAAHLGKNARKKFLEKYELNSWGEKMLSFYNNILNN